MKYKNIKNLLYGTPHMIRDAKLQEICSLVESRAHDEDLEFEEIVEQPQTTLVSVSTGMELESPTGNGNFSSGNLIAVVPLFGTMMQHAIIHGASGGTSTEHLGSELRRLDADPQVGAIVMEVHSPGGQVYGAFELAQQVREMNTRVVTVANSEMASAALLVGTAADEVYGTTGASVGSIGVVTVHTDVSKAEQAAGITTTVISEPRAKAAAVGKSEKVCCFRSLCLDDRFKRQAWAARPVARPVRQQVGRHAGVDNRAYMCAAIAQSA